MVSSSARWMQTPRAAPPLTDDKKNDDLILDCCQNLCAFEEVTASAESRVVRRDVVLITEDRNVASIWERLWYLTLCKPRSNRFICKTPLGFFPLQEPQVEGAPLRHPGEQDARVRTVGVRRKGWQCRLSSPKSIEHCFRQDNFRAWGWRKFVSWYCPLSMLYKYNRLGAGKATRGYHVCLIRQWQEILSPRNWHVLMFYAWTIRKIRVIELL